MQANWMRIKINYTNRAEASCTIRNYNSDSTSPKTLCLVVISSPTAAAPMLEAPVVRSAMEVLLPCSRSACPTARAEDIAARVEVALPLNMLVMRLKKPVPAPAVVVVVPSCPATPAPIPLWTYILEVRELSTTSLIIGLHLQKEKLREGARFEQICK